MMAGIEILLFSVLALQAARLLWGVLAPVSVQAPPMAMSFPSQPVVALSGYEPFFPDAAAAGSGPGLLQGWSLFGIRRAADPAASTAILSQDGQPQSAFRVGDEVADGIVLHEVAADHVLLAQGATTRRLALPDASPAASASGALPSAAPLAATTPASPSAAVPVDPRELFTGTGLRAHREDGRIAGYTVMPGNNEVLLRRAGLQPGDVLLDVNGRALAPGRLLELADELRANPQARVTFRRDGQTHTIDLGGQAP